MSASLRHLLWKTLGLVVVVFVVGKAAQSRNRYYQEISGDKMMLFFIVKLFENNFF